MATAFLSGINLAGTELQNAVVQNLGTAPAHAAGRIYYDTGLGYFRVSNGTTWTDLAPGGTDTEAVQDIVNSMLSANTVVTATYNDAAGTIALTIGTGQVTNAMLAGSISADKLIDGTTNRVFTSADETKLDGITSDAAAGTASLRTLGTGATQAAAGNDPRLSDARTPTAHNHTAANITDFQTAVSGNSDVTANTTARHTHSNKATLDSITAAYTTAEQTKLSGIATGATNYTDTNARANRLDQFAAPTASVSMNSQKITGLATPTAGTDAANKDYVDGVASGLDPKASVRAATTANGALATAFANGQVIDGVTLATGNRILIKNQTTASENGIYTVNASGAPTRATDADSSAEVNPGMFTFVEEGTTNADTGWVLTNNGAITLGTTGLTFAQFSGAGSFTAGSGLTQSGTTFNVGAGTGITVNADDVAINTSVVVRKYAATIGNGAATTIAVTHSLNTQDITWSLRDATSNAFVITDAVATDANTLTFTFGAAPATNSLRVVVHA